MKCSWHEPVYYASEVLCDICKDITFDIQAAGAWGFKHHKSLKRLRTAARDCALCALIFETICQVWGQDVSDLTGSIRLSFQYSRPPTKRIKWDDRDVTGRAFAPDPRDTELYLSKDYGAFRCLGEYYVTFANYINHVRKSLAKRHQGTPQLFLPTC
jgi:hypothetical protein